MNLPVEWANRVIQRSEECKPTLPRPPARSDKLAVIVEFRNDMFLRHVIQIAIHHLAPKGFAFVFVHGTENALLAKTFIEPLGVRIWQLPRKNIDASEYSGLLISRWFWDKLQSEHILLYQIDTYIRHGNIEPFLEYDYVGAPWEPSQCTWVTSKSRVGNGGLSLRRRSAMLRCLDTRPPRYDSSEDMYFSQTCEDLLHLPSTDVARSFAVETWEHPDPLGFHKPWLYLPPDKIYPLLT